MRFVFVNHVTTNPFFVPTRYGAEDACELLNCSYQWTGSESANVNEMVNALQQRDQREGGRHRGRIVDLKAFNEPVQRALDAGIPVVGYNADAAGTPGWPTSARTCSSPARRWASGSSSSSARATSRCSSRRRAR